MNNMGDQHSALSFMFLMMALLTMVVVVSVSINLLDSIISGTPLTSILTLFKTIMANYIWIPVVVFAYFFIVLIVNILKTFYTKKKDPRKLGDLEDMDYGN